MSKHLEPDRDRGGGFARPSSGDTCAVIDALLEPFVDDELSADEQQRVQRHVAACPACADALRRARVVQTGLRSLPLPSCPEHVSQAAIAHAAGRTAARPRARWWLPTGGRAWQPALALAAGVVLALGLGMRSDFPAPTTAAADPAVAQAEAEVKLALAYLGRMGVQTGAIVRDDVLAERVASPVVRSIREALKREDTP